MSDTNNIPKPDAAGTVALSGHETLALEYDLKSSYLEKLSKELGEMKAQLRGLARSVLTDGAKRLFLRNGRQGGVSITLPDYSTAGNRLVFSDKKMSDLVKAGDLSSLGDPAAMFEEEVLDEGGDSVVLRGDMFTWWQQHMAAYNERPDVEVKRTERKVAKRLRAEIIPAIHQLAQAGNKLAEMVLSMGTKEPMVKAER